MVNLSKAEHIQAPPFIEAIADVMQEGLLVLNALNYIEKVNEAAVRMLGFSGREALTGKHIRQIYCTPDHADHFLALLEERGQVEMWHGTFVKRDSSTFAGYCSAIKARADGSAAIKVILFQDISSRGRPEDGMEAYAHRLEKKNKELDQFAYIVSHDLKAPLRAISNLSLWLEEDLGDSLTGESKGYLAMLRSRVQRMEMLINGILEYSKVGRQQMAAETMNVADLLQDVVEVLDPPPHISVMWDAMPVLKAPKTMLFQVFSNLIGNAVKYNDKEEGVVKVSAAETSAMYEFAVKDNGPGIGPEYHDKIFMIFQTLQSRDEIESTGIGLTIVKRIVEEWGGKVKVESGPGQGSKFVFSIPKGK